jgi:hypothetical protein
LTAPAPQVGHACMRMVNNRHHDDGKKLPTLWCSTAILMRAPVANYYALGLLKQQGW